MRQQQQIHPSDVGSEQGERQAKIKNEEPIVSASVDSKHKTHDSPPLRLATQQNSAKGV